MTPILVHTITREDIDKAFIKLPGCNSCGHNHSPIQVSSVIGRIISIDVGKRIYRVGDIYQVENQEQFDRRLGK